MKARILLAAVVLCLVGADIRGTYDFTMTELICGAEPDDPAKCTYAGDSIVTTDKGSIITADTGVMYFFGANGTFTTTAEFLRGTRRYKNASGVFVATGELDFLNGEAAGVYSLEVAHGK